MIIFRYLSREILITLLAATFMLLVVFITNQSVQLLQRAASGHIPATELLELISLQIPLLLGYLLPLGLYLGILLTFSRLYLESEMTVLYACGVSRLKLMKMVLLLAFFVAIVVACLMAVVVPKAQGDLNRIVGTAEASSSVEQIIPNRFMSFNQAHQDVVLYASKTEKNHRELRDVFVAKRKTNPDQPVEEKWDILTSQAAFESTLPDQHGRYLIFKNGYQYSGVPGEKDYHVMQFGEYGVRLTVNESYGKSKLAPQHYSMTKLWEMHKTDLNSAAELQWRMAMPISTLIFALLAVPLSEVHPRYGKFSQLFPAILIYVVYADLIYLTRAWICDGQISPALGMWWVHASAIILAMALILYRMGWMRLRGIFTRSAIT